MVPRTFARISVDFNSSGSIPIHLLTREALQAYKRQTDNAKLLADKRFEDADDIEPIPGLTAWTDGFNNLSRSCVNPDIPNRQPVP